MQRQRFRWGFVIVPLTILGTAWFLRGVEVSFGWDDVLTKAQIEAPERYTRLAVLGLALITVCAVWRVLKNSGK